MTSQPAESAFVARLRSRIETRQAKAAVVGLGYVGLPLAVEVGRAGFQVVGIDTSSSKINRIRKKDCYIPDVDAQLLGELVDQGRLTATHDSAALADCELISICVPTPLRKTKDPDLSYIVEATAALAAHLKPGSLVILESTTYPGTTEEAILPALEKNGMRVGRDFCLCFSPERVDPGNARYSTRDIPKVIGGVTERCTELGEAYYSQIVDRIVTVGSTRVAEMVKLLENTFRMINIGLANEMAIMCDRMGINVWEVIDAAATKPFGFMPFYPGPGLGGHCIPVDPHYLSWKIKQTGYSPRFIELASEINRGMPEFIVEKTQAALNQAGKPVKGSKIHVVGVAYKKDVSDVRESPALDILVLLKRLGAEISYSDPLAPEIVVESTSMASQPLYDSSAAADCVVIVTDHSSVDYARLVEVSTLLIDSRNATRGIESEKIVRL